MSDQFWVAWYPCIAAFPIKCHVCALCELQHLPIWLSKPGWLGTHGLAGCRLIFIKNSLLRGCVTSMKRPIRSSQSQSSAIWYRSKRLFMCSNDLSSALYQGFLGLGLPKSRPFSAPNICQTTQLSLISPKLCSVLGSPRTRICSQPSSPFPHEALLLPIRRTRKPN